MQPNLPSQAVSQQASKRLTHGEELPLSKLYSSVLQAGESVKIKNSLHPEQAVLAVLQKCIVLLGISGEHLPDEIQRSLMISGMIKYYGNHTPEELYLAVELNYFGKFPVKIEHYGKFTSDYLASCLHQFNELRKSAVFAKNAEQNKRTTFDLSAASDESYWTGLVEYWKTSGQAPKFWDWNRTYQHLHDTGQLSHYTADRKKEIRAQVELEMRSAMGKANISNIGSMMDYKTMMHGDNEDKIRLECRKVVVLEMIEQHFKTIQA